MGVLQWTRVISLPPRQGGLYVDGGDRRKAPRYSFAWNCVFNKKNIIYDAMSNEYSVWTPFCGSPRATISPTFLSVTMLSGLFIVLDPKIVTHLYEIWVLKMFYFKTMMVQIHFLLLTLLKLKKPISWSSSTASRVAVFFSNEHYL